MSRQHARRICRYFASICCSVTFASVAVAAHESPQATNRVVRIYLTAAAPSPGSAPTGERGMSREDLEHVLQATRKETERLADTLKKTEERLRRRSGSDKGQWKPDLWPANERTEWDHAKRALDSAIHRLQDEELDLESRHWNPVQDSEPAWKPIDETAQYLRDSFTGRGPLHRKEHVELVDKREEAQLVVEVWGYRRERGCAFALIKVSEGDAILSGTLGTLDLRQTGTFLPGFRDRHSYTKEHPYWILEGFRCTRYGPNVRTAANELAKVFNDRIAKDDWDAFSLGLKVR
jgi:hypothetical protein